MHVPDPDGGSNSNPFSGSICFSGAKGTVNALNTSHLLLKTRIFDLPYGDYQSITVTHNVLLWNLPVSKTKTRLKKNWAVICLHSAINIKPKLPSQCLYALPHNTSVLR